MSNCLSSSRENTTSRRMSGYRCSTVCTNTRPKEPVPPVIRTDLLESIGLAYEPQRTFYRLVPHARLASETFAAIMRSPSSVHHDPIAHRLRERVQLASACRAPDVPGGPR